MTLRRARHPEPARLLPWVERLSGAVAVVWGDFMLDEYWRCLSRRVSREAPVLILEHQGRAVQGGGAANAALNLVALGAKARAVGFVGRDAEGRELRAMLERGGVDCSGLLEHARQATVVKTRIVAGSVHTALQQVVRVDRGRPFQASARERARLAKALSRAAEGASAVLLSDYGYDSVTPELARGAIRRWRTRGVTVGLDARYRVTEYRGVTIATPNESEAATALGVAVEGDQDLVRVAEELLRRIKSEHLLVTRGRDGLTVWGKRGGMSLSAWGGQEAVDVTGAGDAVIAVATLALAVGAGPLECAALANVAGALAVSRRGAVAVSRADLTRALRANPDGAPRRAARGAAR